MTISFRRMRRYVEQFDFQGLFVEELGWAARHDRPINLGVDGVSFRLRAVAQQGSMVVYTCEPATEDADLPDRSQRLRIDKDVTKLAHEHIIIFIDTARTTATWLWVKREAGKRPLPREHKYRKGLPGDSLLQKMARIAFDIDELDDEGRASILEVSRKVAAAFDVERVTKRFYDQFKAEHAAFIKFLKGIDSTGDRAWYTSVMLNRLMFIYFIQKKGFLDSDLDYLRRKLEASRKQGANRYYRHFLTVLFFQGFAHEERERSPEVKRLLGQVPYLNGGLFQPHQIELEYGESIQIPDAAFGRLFDFFDKYTWHLDDRPRRADNEINPDVLGYIFEKYINQKQMGAYYTKEDITGYICRNTILPFLFDKLATLQYDAVHPLPLTDIEPYIYPAVKQGSPLPTETGREQAARRKRLAQIRADFKAGKIAHINDLITYNLDIERFTQDYLSNLNNPMVLRAFYFECLQKLTVLDPTVGSGAFLFAAMNILEPLYEICLDRMRQWAGPKYADFKEELARVDAQPSRRYFIFKSIVVNNLYGVDIMEEATEICKLRLFLKLVAQVDDPRRIEPLPDIDFNIRAGNTLVGYASLDQIEATGNFFTLMVAPKVRDADTALRAFRDLQTQRGISARRLAAAKTDIQGKLKEIEHELNETLRSEYGAPNLQKFVNSHRPFHWYVEFNQIMQNDGFDVIVGNPPFVEYSRVRQDYRIRNYATEACGNLYAYVMERSVHLLGKQGRLGFIVPISAFATSRMESLQDFLSTRGAFLCISNFGIRPSKLFEGAEQRLTICLFEVAPGRNMEIVFSTKYHRWYREERAHLFEMLTYQNITPLVPRFGYPKISSQLEFDLLSKMPQQKLGEHYDEDSPNCIYWHRIPGYFIKAVDFVPYFRSNRDGVKKSEDYKLFRLRRTEDKHTILALLNSSLFYWYWFTISEGYHCGKHEVLEFPIDFDRLDSETGRKLSTLAMALMASFKENAVRRTRKQKTTEVEYDEFYPSQSKPILDEIDRVLAHHYGLTDKEIDFILNYDSKYRMGKNEEEEA